VAHQHKADKGKDTDDVLILMTLADVHAHLELIPKQELAGSIQRAKDAGVGTIITQGTDVASNRTALHLSEQFSLVKAALGLYPLSALAMSDAEIEDELAFIMAHSAQIVAIGEIGLDYQETSDRDRQQRIFERQLDLAQELGKPVIVHSRKAEKAVIETLIRMHSRRVILHAFHGNMALVREAVSHGYYFSVPANVLRSSHMQLLVRAAGIGNILTETDTPYLGPHADGKSEPAHVALTVQKIAEILALAAEDVTLNLGRNFDRVFGTG
jgi:TatD DNase family protein